MDTRRLQHYLRHASITNTVRYTAMSPPIVIAAASAIPSFRMRSSIC
jgi:hypothetical protein